MTGKSTSNILTIICCLVLAFGCIVERLAGKEKDVSPAIPKQNQTTDSVDPLTLTQDTVPVSRLIGERSGRAHTRLVAPSRIFPGGDTLAADSLNAQAFRVQLTLIDTYSDGRRALAVAQEIFDQPVTLDYEVPYYKLRVGEFPTRKEAELYQQKARGAGYANAWVMVATLAPRQVEGLYTKPDSLKSDSAR